jgi:anti-sigma-K factor RskA
MEDFQNGKTKIQYLLGELSAEEQLSIDEQLFVNDDYFERLMATEDDLIEDYLRGRLSATERQQFERNFLNSAELRKKVDRTKLLLRYIDDPDRRPRRPAISKLFTQGLSAYQTSLRITALFRVALLVTFCLLFYFLSSTSSVASPVVFRLFIFLSAVYAVLEVISARRSVKVAQLAIAETQSEE